MTDLMPFVVAGLVAGALYGLAATGLVLTYKTSGVFNFAHGAIGAGAAYLFYDLRDLHGMPALGAAVLVVGVAAPLVGLVLSVLAGRLSGATTAQRVVATVGVLLVVQGLIQLHYGVTPITISSFLPSGSFRLVGVNVGYDQLITSLTAVAAVGLLELLFRRTRLGLQMRAVVDNGELLDLAGQSPAGVRASAWVIGAAFAAVSGILLAPSVGLDALVLTLVVVQAFGAAAIARFDSTGLAFVGGLAIGVAANLLNAPRVRDLLPFLADLPGIDQTVPFLVLFAVLLLTRRGVFADRGVRREPRLASPLSARGRLLLTASAAGIALAAPFLEPTRLPVFTAGAVFLTVFASLFLLTEESNQVSLCHVGFVAIGATTFCHLTTGAGLPWPVGVIAAGLVVVPVGAFVALPAIRLSGLFLALATFGFGILLEKLLYSRGLMFGRLGARYGSRPSMFGLDADRAYYFLCLAIGVGAVAAVVLVRRSRLGRLLQGLADSPVALATFGASINVTRVLVFCLSAFMAGTAGALYVGVVGSVGSSGASVTTLTSFNSLLWLAVLAIAGRSPVVAPVLATLALVVAPSYLTNPDTAQYLTLCFGLLAVMAATFGDAMGSYFAREAVAGQHRCAHSPVRARHQVAIEGIHPVG